MGKFKGILKSLAGGLLLATAFLPGIAGIGEIGRASCRERV